MWPDRRLCDLLDIEHPIIQAPMVGSDSGDLTAAVSNAGGLGSVGCGEWPVDKALGAIDAAFGRTNRPFNVNFFVRGAAHTPDDVLQAVRTRLAPWYDEFGLGDVPRDLPEIGESFDDARLQMVLERRPKVVSFHFGIPEPKVIAQLKGAGIRLICTATNVAEARLLETAGMDAIIAQSWEAGGHRGQFGPRKPWDGIGGMSLIPQIASAVSVPIIAAGGIADGRGIVAAFALGAAGVQLGTAFLRCPEASTDAPRRAALAGSQDTDTMMIDSVSGRPARGLRSRYSEDMERDRVKRADFTQMAALVAPLRAVAPDEDVSFHLFGQSSAMGRDLPAREVLDLLVKEAGEVFARLG